MLSEMQVRETRLYWKEQLAACEVDALKGPIRVIIVILEEILEIKDGE